MRDPLLHFVLLGIVIFGLHRLLRSDVGTVEITVSMVEAAEADFSRRTGEAPGEEARAQLLEQLIEEELLYREGQALALAEGDVVLRRRLITRMRLLLASTASPTPTDADLAALLAAHPERYTRPASVTFRHIFLNATRHPSLSDATRRAEAQLLAGAPPESLGDPFLHGRAMVEADAADIAEKLGADFAGEILGLPAGEWLPVASDYGEHLVFIDAHHPARPATRAEARPALTADWQTEARSEAEDAALAVIRERYRVVLP
ncbi:MAG: peptidyl-prolyl cis-trans isomerase C [Myxococcota bacterium]|jgi:peptidyl-prolyl cis-trans isomerase C